nr:hypothetical protein [Tanacetum cinerariifolium]
EATVVKMVLKKKKLEAQRRMCTRDSVSPPPTTVPKGTGKHPRVLARFVRSLANSSDSLTPDKLRFLSFGELVDVFDVLALQTAVVGNMLTNESRILSQGFSPLRGQKLFESEHFNQALEDLQQKAITYGRSQALDEVYDLGNSLDFKDVQDYHPKAGKLFDKDSEAFYKLEFPYISLLSALSKLWLLRLPSSRKPLLHDVIFFYIRKAL